MKSATFLFFTLCSFFSFSQITTPIIKTDDAVKIKLENSVAGPSLSNNIKALEIIDLRDDTGSLGYCFTKLPKKVNRITFDSASGHIMGNWLSTYLKINNQNSSGDKLVILLKKLRLSEEVTLVVYDNGHQGQPQNGWDEGLLIKMEFYLKKEQIYYPLYRYDSVISVKGKLPNDAAEFLIVGFTAAVSKLFTLNLQEMPLTIRRLSLNDIITRNNKESAVPVLIETVYRKGVYKTFEEFKMNKPSIFDFEYKKGKMGDMLYLKDGENEYPDRTVWGFCDGKNFFINSSDLFSELIRDGNTFYFRGIKSISKKVRHNIMKASLFNLATNTGEKRTKYQVENKYYQLDMETGEAY